MVSCAKCGTIGESDALWCARCGFPLGKSTDASRGTITVIDHTQRSLINFFSPSCPSCKTKGQIVCVGLTTITKNRGIGIVTRTDKVTKEVTLSSGETQEEKTTVKRQERVPVVRGKQRIYYRCSACGHAWTKTSSYEFEDLAPTQPQPTVVVSKEVTKIPCKYCGNLVNLNEVNICPSCGGRLY